MNKLVLYIFDGNELEEVITGLYRIKKYIQEYENNTKRTVKKVGTDSGEAQSTATDS